MYTGIIGLAYLAAAILFIFGLKGLTHPRTAVRGNLLGALGMLLAIVVTLLDQRIVGFGVIIVGLLTGGVIGTGLAIKVRMTAMPQMVALLNGFGGGASALVAGAAFIETLFPTVQMSVATAASGLIGGVTFWGSLVAFGKLQSLITEKSIFFRGQRLVNVLVVLVALLLAFWLVYNPAFGWSYLIMLLVASGLGILLVIPVGGADMPVVIALLNSFSGLAAAATGFVLNNTVLIIGGSLVGASGMILTMIMSRAMNRSLANVMLGSMGKKQDRSPEEDVYGGRIKSTSAEEIAMILDAARRVVFVPGYGLAVSQAQHAVKNLMRILEARGIEVDFGIHPVAGRMPGHMNVLLAEAEVPYDKMKDMDQINPMLEQTDVAIVIGANDVVNPVAQSDPSSPIAGMPIIEVGKARTVIVIKRSLSPGFAGIPNPLFSADNTLMFFNDGQQAIRELIGAISD